ncbi:unnamed protein product [Microthlaspi erraticum]|uniref:Reverse transcriptase domain-containing protein n=1 Tax=Microthlaspi erraticum TaxID=1685480 RepID=A0A6D2LDD6_9BRAS|nr:unnamed protein product [Microthlaspi erraticum]
MFTSGIMPRSINNTHVRLIPKILSPKSVSEYRPVALCNVYYKIISKILTSRLQSILPLIIYENQTAFVPGRDIADNILITHETLSGATKRCSMAVKTDVSKSLWQARMGFCSNGHGKDGIPRQMDQLDPTMYLDCFLYFPSEWRSLGTSHPTERHSTGRSALTIYLHYLCWRILNNPSSLLARVLKGKYCNSEDFLTVPVKPSTSHGWRGILIGRDLLNHKLGKAVGSGQTTSIWHDPWLCLKYPSRPLGPPNLQEKDMLVSELLTDQPRGWNKGKIEKLLPHHLSSKHKRCKRLLHMDPYQIRGLLG